MSVPRLPKATSESGLGSVIRSAGFVRLLVTRLTAQWGDGFFQAALGGAVLFNPEREAEPLVVAAGLAVLLLPYSFVGPFTGALLDRWDRRQVLIGANLLRAVLILVVALAVGTGVTGPGLYLAALAVVAVSRFLLAGLSAALPHVVVEQPGEPRVAPAAEAAKTVADRLVKANVLATTLGAAAAAIGGASAICVRGIVGAGNSGSAVTTTFAIAGSLAAALAAAGFARGFLGPDRAAGGRPGGRSESSTLHAIGHGLSDGAGAVLRTPSVSAAFAALAAHRLAFGLTTLVSLLLFRYRFTDEGLMFAGFAGVGQTVVVVAAGIGVAAVLTPWLTHRLGRARTTRLALVVAALAMAALALALTLPMLLAVAFVVGTAGQVVKLCADAAIQSDTDDAVRGRVFALYDALFNVCYVLAITAAALLSPPDGYSPPLVAGAAAVYLLGVLGHAGQLRRRSPS